MFFCLRIKQRQVAESAYLEEVRKSDTYIGILGQRYGVTETGKISPTEVEFREAKSKHKEILIYIKGQNTVDEKRDSGVQKLIKEIKNPKAGYSYRRFENTDELTNLVYESLISFLKEKGEIGKAGFDQRICEGAKFSDIDNTKVKLFLKVARSKRNFPLGSEKAPRFPSIQYNIGDRLVFCQLYPAGRVRHNGNGPSV